LDGKKKHQVLLTFNNSVICVVIFSVITNSERRYTLILTEKNVITNKQTNQDPQKSDLGEKEA
jgi:hypothetical protein